MTISYLRVLIIAKVSNERSIRWLNSRERFLGVWSVAMNLKSHHAEAIQQNTVQRNARMFIGPIRERLIESKRNVCFVANYLALINVKLKGESIALMSVQTKQQLRKKSEFVHIVETHLRSILLHLIFVVLGNAELQDRKLLIGRSQKRFFVSVFSVGRNFGKNHQILRDGRVVANFVLVLAKLILKELTTVLNQVSMALENGFRQGKGFSKGITILVRNVDLLVRGFMSIIRSLSEMAGQKMTAILSHFVQLVIYESIGKMEILENRLLGLQVEPEVTQAICPS